jgi:diadenosine tetraphosphate (Ap4A) HIT family hydrolase
MDEVGATGYTLAMHEGAPGQPLPHAHLHVLPRHELDDLDLPKPDEADRDELTGLAVRLRRRLLASQ